MLKQVPGAVDVTPDQSWEKGYVDIDIDRKRAARYGVNVGDIQDVIEVALGGNAVTMTVEGRERFPVRIRYARRWREDEEDVKNLLVSAAGGRAAVGMRRRCRSLRLPLHGRRRAHRRGPEHDQQRERHVAVLRATERPRPRHHRFRRRGPRAVEQKVKLPQGISLQWSGQFEHQVRAKKTLQVVFPAVLLLIFIILYLTYNDLMDAVLMMMAVPEALVGGVLFLWLRGYNFSVAVQVGFIACFGMATETGIIMLVYLREAIEAAAAWKRSPRWRSSARR